LLLIVPAVAVKVPLLAPLPMLMLAGTLSTLLLLDRLTVAVPFDGLVSVTVQVELCPLPSELGEQLKPDNCGAVTRLIDAVFDTPLSLAVTVAVASLLRVPAAAVKLPLLAPLPMLMLAGTVNVPLLLDKLTVVVPLDALVNVTVQVELCPLPSELGEQLRLLRLLGLLDADCRIVIVPPVPLVGYEIVPVASIASSPLSEIGVLVLGVPEAIVKVAVAMIPFGIGVVVKPYITHLVEVLLKELHASA
jgi:hypothetical protein